MSSEGEDNSLGRSSQKGSNRIPRCSLCRNHGYVVDLKNHKRYCKWKNCKCVACLGTMQKRKVNANQVAARRAAKQDSELGEPASVSQPVSIGFSSQPLQLGVLPPRLSPMPPEEPSFTVYDTFKRVKDGISFLQTQYQSLKLDCEKLNTERANIQRHYSTYYEMSYELKLEMHKQAEISKRLNAIIAQILPYLTVEHQQQVISAVERAKQISMNELNGFTRLSDTFPQVPGDATLLPPVSHATNFATSPPFTPNTGGLCPSPRGSQAPVVHVGGHEGLQPLIPLPNVSMASGVSLSASHLPQPPPQQPISSSERDHGQRELKKKQAEPEQHSSRSPVIVECRSVTAAQPQKDGQSWPIELATNNNSRDADCEDSDGYRSDQESILDVVNEDPRSPLVAGGIRNGMDYGERNEDLTRHGFSVLAHSEFRQLGSERFLQERPLSIAARM